MISIDALNYAVQLTIDRILFFRMAEDRGIERYKTSLEKSKTVYKILEETEAMEALLARSNDSSGLLNIMMKGFGKR